MVGNVRQAPVLVGLSGGLDSLVAAYLLKIQKRELYAAVIASTPEQFQDAGEQLFACHQSEERLKAVKKFCDHLQIPLTVIRPREEFQDSVLEPWMAAKVQGKRPRQCSDCHAFRLQLLWRQMRELKCQSLATGHYAKLVRSAPEAPVNVYSSNDLEFDQSHLLATLPQSLLSSLELPLAELQKKEILKIAENFALTPGPREVSFGHCLPPLPVVTNWLSAQLPKAFARPGEFVQGESTLGDHEGVASFQYGELAPDENLAAKELVVLGFDWTKKSAHLGSTTSFLDTGVFLRGCQWDHPSSLGAPVKGYLHRGGGLNDLEVLVTPRTLGGAWVTLLEPDQTILFELGRDLAVYRRRGKNAKVLVVGEMFRLARDWGKNTIEIEGNGGPTTNRVLDKDFNF